MAKRASPKQPGRKKAEAPFNNPFAEAARALEEKSKKASPTPPKPVAPPPPKAAPVKAAPSDRELFEAAVGALARRNADPRGRASAPPPPKASELKVADEDTEALAELAALVGGDAVFDISDSDEFIEGCVEGLDRRVLRKLKRGDFAVAAHLDLHGLTREPARDAVLEFVTRCQREERRCVLIVHGRGKGSKDQIPVLKTLLKGWLERGPIAKKILAFSTARPHDGGAGALYVLLRR